MFFCKSDNDDNYKSSGLIGKIWLESVCSGREVAKSLRRGWCEQEVIEETHLSWGQCPSIIDQWFSTRNYKEKGCPVHPCFGNPIFFLDLKLFNVWNALVQKKMCHFWWLNTTVNLKPCFKFTLDAKQKQFCNRIIFKASDRPCCFLARSNMSMSKSQFGNSQVQLGNSSFSDLEQKTCSFNITYIPWPFIMSTWEWYFTTHEL